MDQFLKHKKAKALVIGIGMILLGFLGLKLGLLPADNPETPANETMQALMMLIGSGGGLAAVFIGAQGWSDGKSLGATATKIGPAILLALTLPFAFPT